MDNNIINENVLIELVETLIGDTGFYGCSNRDSVSLKNIDRLNIVGDLIINNLTEKVRYHRNDYRASGKALSDKAVTILKSYKSFIENTLELLEEEN